MTIARALVHLGPVIDGNDSAIPLFHSHQQIWHNPEIHRLTPQEISGLGQTETSVRAALRA